MIQSVTRLGRIVERRMDRLLEWLSRRVTETTGCIFPLLAYAAIAFILPPVFHWAPLWYVWLSFVSLAVCAFVGFAWIVALKRAGDRRRLLEWTSDLRRLDAEEFEWLVGEIYSRKGYRIAETGSQHSSDGNIDLIAEKGDQRLIIQCKRWTSWSVPVAEIQRFAGTFPAKAKGSTGRVFVTLSEFTPDACVAADNAGIGLVDGRQLAEEIEGARRTEPCPDCGRAMLLDRSRHGWWLRCPHYSAGCTGKRDLGRDPGRAVDVLLDQVAQPRR
jgi:HJR/Mrr/RecB family endonuclease